MELQGENDLKEWVDDKLGRRKDAEFLTSYLIGKYKAARKEESFVLNLNAEWGYGKTFFLERWKEDLIDQGYPVIYYDAWRTDFSKEPLLAFMSEFYSQIRPYLGDGKGVNDSLRGFFKAALNYRKPILNALVKKYVGSTPDDLTEGAEFEGGDDEGSDARLASDIMDKAIDQYLKDHEDKKNSIDRFKVKIEEVATYIEEEVKGKQLPIFVFVDELDRCRPTYSIELLENIKHLFLSKSVCFVIATDSDQLGKSIKAVYGGEFDSERYLNRFFDHEYVIPEPDNIKFSEYLCEEYCLVGDMLFTPLESVPQTFAILSDYFRLRLREQHHAAAMLEAIKLSQHDSQYHDLDVFYLLFLIMLKITKSAAYKQYIYGNKTNDLIKRITVEEDNYNQSIDFLIREIARDPNAGHMSEVEEVMSIVTIISRYTYYFDVDLLSDEWGMRHGNSILDRKLSNRFLNQKPSSYVRGDIRKTDLNGYIRMVNQVGQLS